MRATLPALALVLLPALALAAAPAVENPGLLLVVTERGWEARPVDAADAPTAECGGPAPAVTACETSALRTKSTWSFGVYAPAWGTSGTGFFEGSVSVSVTGSDGRYAYMDCPVFAGAGGVARGFCEAGGNPFPGMGALVQARASVSSVEGADDLAPMGEWRAFLDI